MCFIKQFFINKIAVWQTTELLNMSQIIFKYPREFISIIGFRKLLHARKTSLLTVLVRKEREM